MIKNLVISGGGIKIISALGVIKYLEEKDLIKNIKNFYGTSAGSLLCLLLVLNFNSSEIIKFTENFDFNKIFIVNTDNFFSNFNICDNLKLEKVIKLFINFKLGHTSTTINQNYLLNDNKYENITMNELFLHTFKHLIITTVSLKFKKAIYIDHITFPNLPVWKAILMSCSIPLIFKPIEWENDLYIDGGLIDNFPLFNIPRDEIKYTLGIEILLDMNETDICFTNIYDYILNLIKIIMESKTEIKSYNIISILITSNIIDNFLNVNINKNIKIELINQGYSQTKDFFKIKNNNINFHFDEYKNNIKSRKRSNSL